MSITVQFTDTSTPGPSGPITDWLWDFGDSSTSTSESPSHAYATAGLYSVQLTITGSGVDGTATTILSVVVLDQAAINAQFTSSASGRAVTFTDASTPGPSGPITAWHWDFGDGNTSSSQNPSHTYSSNGNYTVVLTVTGTSPDGTDNVTHSVTASAAGTTFISISESDYPRPSFSPSRTVNFSTAGQLSAAISGMAAGDLIKYNGSGKLVIQGTSGSNLFSLNGKNPSSDVVIDFGTSHCIWNPSLISPNYVVFTNTGTVDHNDPWVIQNCSNIRIYGGEIGPNLHGSGMRVFGNTHDCQFYDQYITHVGGSGLMMQPIDSHSGSPSSVTNCVWRQEINRPCLYPTLDPHADKGTGIHGAILHGNGGNQNNNVYIIYAHDSLQPGETSVGKVWPEGAGGSGLEPGQSGGGQVNNNKYYVLCERFNMVCLGTNPGSNGAKQTGGNVIDQWGPTPNNGCEYVWIEGNDISGQVFHGTSENWKNASPAVTITHGRSSNTNQAYPNNNLSSSTDPYQRFTGVVYNDCT